MSTPTRPTPSSLTEAMEDAPVMDVSTDKHVARASASAPSRATRVVKMTSNDKCDSVDNTKSAKSEVHTPVTNPKKRSRSDTTAIDGDVPAVTPVNNKKRSHPDAIVTEGDFSESFAKSKKKTGNEAKSSIASSSMNASAGDSEGKCKASTAKKVVKPAQKNAFDSGLSPADSPPVKRVRTSKHIPKKRGPSFQGPNADVSAFNGPSTNFSTTIFKVELGPDGPSFHVHEFHLIKSSKLAEEVTKAKAKKRQTQQQLITLFPHDAAAFGQMVGYLYNGDVLPNPTNNGGAKIGRRMKEFHELMSLAKHYDLPGLQKKVVSTVGKTRMMYNVTAGPFFDWAEDMYYEELDHVRGPFKSFFNRKAPYMLATATADEVKSILSSIEQGGEYAKELFLAAHKAIFTEGPNIVTKRELVDNDLAPDMGFGSDGELFVPAVAPASRASASGTEA